MSDDNRARLKQWLASGEASLHPLTLPQRELWEAAPVPPADVSNHICCFIQVQGALTPDLCRAAVQKVVNRQEALRISFLSGKEQPLQLVRATGDANFHYRELQPSQGQSEAIEELGHEIFRQPFDLVRGPLYRVEMLRKAANEYVLAFAIHHAVADGWTLGVFVQDLCAAYVQGLMGGGSGLSPVPQTYTAWGSEERAHWNPAELDKRAAFWQSKLGGARRLWSPPSSTLGIMTVPERRVSEIPPHLAAAARELGRRNGATLFSTLLAAFQNALSEWIGADDVLVGTPVANRTKMAVRETMGYFAGIVPLRGRIDAGQSAAARIRTVHQDTVEAFANAVPFAELVPMMGEPHFAGQNPIFQVRFALQNHPIPDVNLPGLSARLRMRSTGTPRFDLGCEITEIGDALEVIWLSRHQIFSNDDIQALDRIFQGGLASACRSPERRATLLTT